LAFEIAYSPDVEGHLRVLTARGIKSRNTVKIGGEEIQL